MESNQALYSTIFINTFIAILFISLFFMYLFKKNKEYVSIYGFNFEVYYRNIGNKKTIPFIIIEKEFSTFEVALVKYTFNKTLPIPLSRSLTNVKGSPGFPIKTDDNKYIIYILNKDNTIGMKLYRYGNEKKRLQR
jgi:hypothetical protein